MSNIDLALLAQSLERLREANMLLEQTDAGVATLHLDACIAALESRMRKAEGSHPLQAIAG